MLPQQLLLGAWVNPCRRHTFRGRSNTSASFSKNKRLSAGHPEPGCARHRQHQQTLYGNKSIPIPGPLGETGNCWSVERLPLDGLCACAVSTCDPRCMAATPRDLAGPAAAYQPVQRSAIWCMKHGCAQNRSHRGVEPGQACVWGEGQGMKTPLQTGVSGPQGSPCPLAHQWTPPQPVSLQTSQSVHRLAHRTPPSPLPQPAMQSSPGQGAAQEEEGWPGRNHSVGPFHGSWTAAGARTLPLYTWRFVFSWMVTRSAMPVCIPTRTRGPRKIGSGSWADVWATHACEPWQANISSSQCSQYGGGGGGQLVPPGQLKMRRCGSADPTHGLARSMVEQCSLKSTPMQGRLMVRGSPRNGI